MEKLLKSHKDYCLTKLDQLETILATMGDIEEEDYSDHALLIMEAQIKMKEHKKTPLAGLEPATTGLKGPRSTD